MGDRTSDVPPDRSAASDEIAVASEIRAKGQRDDFADLSTGPVPYFTGTPVLFCQRQNTGRTGLDDLYSPVS
jgi:ATP-dependent helicase YprA (DUF1998 family)